MEEVFTAGKNRLSSSIGRWAGVGPYYAMFPISFAFDIVEKYCPVHGSVLDPFAGRGSSIYAASATGRFGCGIEINKVGWVYGSTKLNPAPMDQVLARNEELETLAKVVSENEIDLLPLFFQRCFTLPVLRYLLAMRHNLDWENNQTDRTLIAITLIYLHGAKEKSLSNQMRQGKSMSQEYSIRWWLDHDSVPPDINPVKFMEQRIRWRYAKGVLPSHPSRIYLGNSSYELQNVKHLVDTDEVPKFDLLFTSPPYFNVTSYYYDQWLRLWMLGESSLPTKTGGEWQDGFWSKSGYIRLLEDIFSKSAELLKNTAKIYVRTDAREFTRQTTLEVLRNIFPQKKLEIIPAPLTKASQTALFGDKAKKPGEIDIYLYD
jgi:hypothetical protein